MRIRRILLDKSPLLRHIAICVGNKIKVGNNRFIVNNYHFQKNHVQLNGMNNSFRCEEASYCRNSNVYINGKNNEVCIRNETFIGGGTSIHFDGNDNQLIIGANCTINNSSFFIHGSHNRISIGDSCRLMETKIHIEGQNNLIQIGRGCTFHGRTSYPNTLFSDEGGKILIGDDAMFAHGIRIRPTDSHCILDSYGNRINPPEDIKIGNHCWIGLDVVLLKGTHIPNNCVVAARAVCTKKYIEEHCILAGIPAEIVKRDIDWERELK